MHKFHKQKRVHCSSCDYNEVLDEIEILSESLYYETLLKIRDLRDKLREAEKTKCICSSFVLQYEGSCYCEAYTIKAIAKQNFWRVINQL